MLKVFDRIKAAKAILASYERIFVDRHSHKHQSSENVFKAEGID